MTPAIACDQCGRRSIVGDTRINPDGTVHRRRRCHACRHRWFTTEIRRSDLEALKAQLALQNTMADARNAMINELIARLESHEAVATARGERLHRAGVLPGDL